MIKFFRLALIFFLFSTASAQTDLPGILNAGVVGQLYPLLPADSIHFGKVKMQKELILVNLYPGFAVVKAEYRFMNTTDESIRMMIGFPVQGHYPQRIVENVHFADLFNFRAVSNSLPVKTIRVKDTVIIQPAGIPAPGTASSVITTWEAWEQDFPSRNQTIITVYFITQHNLSRYIKGKESRDGNAFGFMLEAGNAWGGNIGIGQVLIKLNEKLTLLNVYGILPDKQLVGDMQHLQYSFFDQKSNLEKNLLVWYEGAPPDYKFDKKVLPSTDTLYQIMDNFPLSEFNNPDFRILSRKDFSLAKSGMTLPGILYFLMFFMPWIILAVLIVYLLKGKKEKIESRKSKIENNSREIG